MKENKLFIQCDCGCSAIELSHWEPFKDDEEILFLSIWRPCFYTNQRNIFSEIWYRIKMGFTIIFKGDYQLYDLILNKEDLVRLKHYVNNFKEEI